MSLSAEIIAAYHDHPTIYTAAKRCGCPRQVARRVLISAGLYSTPRTQQVQAMLSSGLTVDQVAAALGVTRTAVVCNMPYSLGCRADAIPSAHALRMRKYRKRLKNMQVISEL